MMNMKYLFVLLIVCFGVSAAQNITELDEQLLKAVKSGNLSFNIKLLTNRNIELNQITFNNF